MSDFRIKKSNHSGISYGKETRYYHVSKKSNPNSTFDVFEILENADCDLCSSRDTECFSFSVFNSNYDNGDDYYAGYLTEDEVFICSECLKNANNRLAEHQNKKKNMTQKAKSLKTDIGEIVVCTMEDGTKVTGALTKIVEKNHKIFIRKKGNINSTGIDLMEIEKIEVK